MRVSFARQDRELIEKRRVSAESSLQILFSSSFNLARCDENPLVAQNP